MNFLRSLYLKKTSAIVFISLLVFVHAVKALHTHEISLACSHQCSDDHAAAVKADFSCNICDFQIAKDSDALTSTIQLATPGQYTIIFYNYTLPLSKSVIETSSGTDPPSFA